MVIANVVEYAARRVEVLIHADNIALDFFFRQQLLIGLNYIICADPPTVLPMLHKAGACWYTIVTSRLFILVADNQRNRQGFVGEPYWQEVIGICGGRRTCGRRVFIFHIDDGETRNCRGE